MRPSSPSADLAQIATMTNLRAAWRAVRRNRGDAGLDGVTLQDFQTNVETYLQRIQQELRAHTYTPEALRHVALSKRDGRRRCISIPTVADRVVQHAILTVLEPCFEPTFAPCSYGFRPGRSAHQAAFAVCQSLQAGCQWVVEADLKDFFDTLDWTVLRQALATQIADPHVLDLIQRFLQAGALRGPHAHSLTQGTPQGAVFSPLAANVYLTGFDRLMTTRGYNLVRYGDDFVTLHRTQEEARAALAYMREVLEGQLKLRLHRDKTGITDCQHLSFEFLSFRFANAAISPAPQAVERFQNRVRQLIDATHQKGLAAVIERLNPLIRGWGEYFKIGQVSVLYQQLDIWLATHWDATWRRPWSRVPDGD
jgi:RNA-directed DNA polymerase